MIEKNIENYKPGVRKFGIINWVGAKHLYIKEVNRFLIVWSQTLFAPLITTVLFYMVFSISIGSNRPDVLGVSYMNFLLPGLISMSCIQQSFSHSSSSLLMGKMMGTIVDTISSPLSSSEVVLATILASVTRSFMIAIISIFVFFIFIDVKIYSYLALFCFLFLSSFILGATGFIAGLWAEKFDHMASITNFVLLPLSFLSGTFYSISKLPIYLQTISEYNPFFCMIDGIRYGFLGNSDGSIKFELIYLVILSIIMWYLSYLLYKKGWKIKS
tara:strand:- start:1351 stop:2166 length:816 start_codon:yes stop_codon:yes gene_type:complete